MGAKNLDNLFDEEQDKIVKSSSNMFRYKKKYKKGNILNGRKQARFHIKDKDLPDGVRRD